MSVFIRQFSKHLKGQHRRFKAQPSWWAVLTKVPAIRKAAQHKHQEPERGPALVIPFLMNVPLKM